ncbi:alpha/beta hydrolase [Streptomyces phaeochromogenes]
MRHRELMISVWYPALAPRRGQRLAPYMERGAAERFDALEPHRIPPGTVDWAGTRTHAYREAPADPRGGRRPVVVYSPGVGDPRSWGTLLAEELSSHGYVVVTVDHTYESPGVQFPDGSVRTNEVLFEEFARAQREGTVPALLEKTLRVRVADARFVVNRLGALPHGLSEVLDTDRVGLAGQSGGRIHRRSEHVRGPENPSRDRPGRHPGVQPGAQRNQPLASCRPRPGPPLPPDGP